MRWLRRSALLLGLVTLLGSGTAFAQSPVPHLLNVQGVLRNVAGEVVTGQYPMTFRLFVDESGGAPLMEYPSPTPVDVTGGVFSVNVPVLTNLFADNPTMWLELQVGTDLMPRREVTSVGYAFMAERAQECVTLLNAAPDLDCSGEGCVDASELDPSIFWARADAPGGAAVDVACEDPNGCIIGSEIVDLTIEEADLADGAVTSPKLASDLTFTGDTTAGNLLVKGFLYTGDDFTAGNIRMTPGGALQNITTQQMSGQLTNTVATGTAPP
ncbi:MAG: hypothetical protein FJ087_15475, partial [Deltaproteobacteria bacterium]|nr:hypothetical protein [Deltaproteobacteria bacterium]